MIIIIINDVCGHKIKTLLRPGENCSMPNDSVAFLIDHRPSEM